MKNNSNQNINENDNCTITIYARDVFVFTKDVKAYRMPQHLFLLNKCEKNKITILRGGPRKGNGLLFDRLHIVEAEYKYFNRHLFARDYFTKSKLQELPFIELFKGSQKVFSRKILAMRRRMKTINSKQYNYRMISCFFDVTNSNSAIYSLMLAAKLPAILPRYSNGDSVIAPGFGSEIKN